MDVHCFPLSMQAFVDLALLKLDRRRFDTPIDPNEHSNLQGSFAKVVKRNFNTHVSPPLYLSTICKLYVCIYMYIVHIQECLLCRDSYRGPITVPPKYSQTSTVVSNRN